MWLYKKLFLKVMAKKNIGIEKEDSDSKSNILCQAAEVSKENIIYVNLSQGQNKSSLS